MPPQTPTATVLLLLTLILSTHIHHTSATITIFTKLRNFSVSHTLLSVSHALIHRVSTVRLSRADFSGALRAQVLAGKLELLMSLRFWRPTLFSFCWDFYRNYAWLQTVSFKDKAEFNQLMTRSLAELTQVRNGNEWAAWVDRNYDNVRLVFNSVVARLHSVLTKPGPLKEMLEILKEEMEEGDFVKDCLEVGAKDLRSLIQILKELSSQYTTSHPNHKVEL
ncbi:hypothetical protein vseg_008895 [Gypsophila vaccaria]